LVGFRVISSVGAKPSDRIKTAVHEVAGESDGAGFVDDGALPVVFVGGRLVARLDQWLIAVHISSDLVLIVKEAIALCKCVTTGTKD
jgi:hypothetical protein